MNAGSGDREILRFLICGAARAGRSTLIGCMLRYAGGITGDRTDGPSAASASTGAGGAAIDLALLLDRLPVAHEPGLTADVAYRAFSTAARGFGVADLPGEGGDTRRLADAASTAQAAVVVVDAERGILAETRRQSFVAGMMGVGTVILAVNKMDRVDFDQAVFESIAAAYRDFAAKAGIDSVIAIPVAALAGDNVGAPSPRTPWYEGPHFLEALEALDPRPSGPAVAGPEPTVSDQFAAKLLWMDAEPLVPERRYVLRLGTAETAAAVTELKYRFNMSSLEHMAAKTLAISEAAFCNLALERPIAVCPFADNPALGAFILIDRVTGATVGAGTIAFSLRRATNVRWQELEIGKTELAVLKDQKPAVVWLTGLPGAGKSTIANLVQKRLHAMGRHTYLLDGDNLRHGINKDLGFVEADRVENIRRVAEVAKLFVDSGTIVLVSLISPYRRERLMARELVEDGEFIEVFVDTPLAVCEARDPKGLYRKARSGELINFTGVDAPYERPENPEVTIDGAATTAEAAADAIIDCLLRRGHIGGS